MTQEEKQLLIRDICARLPYGVYVKFNKIKLYNEPLCLSVKDVLAIYNGGEHINDLQYLYLRPMSSMTEEEKELMKGSVICFNELEGNSTLFDEVGLDWLNKNHFDYRGLIPIGLALEAPEGMYK